LVSHIKGTGYTEGVWQQSGDEIIPN